MIPPILSNKHIPTDKVCSSTAFAEELDSPLVDESVLVEVSGSYRVWVVISLECTSSHLVDELSCASLVAGSELALCEHIINLLETKDDHV